MTAASEYTIAFLGDTSFGENYIAEYVERGDADVLAEHGYAYCLANFRDFLLGCNLAIANLETPLAPPGPDPWLGRKAYVHWSDPERAPAELAAHNVRAVSLANNHTLDYGSPGLDRTLESLARHGIACFGAGHDAPEAGQPFLHDCTFAGRTEQIAVFGAFEQRRRYVTDFGFYADEGREGVSKLKLPDYAKQIGRFKQEHPDTFIIVFPHWGNNYEWHSPKQVREAHALLDAGADLIIGHGAHMLGAIERYRDRWIVYSIGNWVFNTEGRYDLPGAVPYSLVAKLTFAAQTDGPKHTLRLYPILSDNARTGYQPRFVDEVEFEAVLGSLEAHSPDGARLIREGELQHDETGLCLELRLS